MRVLGSAWPRHFNKTDRRDDAREHRAGRPAGVDRGRPDAGEGAAEGAEGAGGRAGDEAPAAARPRVDPDDEKRGGGSDDIGDISWNVPTVTLRYPANIPAGPGHNWANAISMATPIAHKGVDGRREGRQAMTVIDLLTRPELVTQAWDYFKNVQTKNSEIHAASSARKTSRRSGSTNKSWPSTGPR